MKIMLTVLLPVLNEEKYLDKCLGSLFSQTYRNFKIICINDGSTDGTGLIIAKWKKKYSSRMQVVTHEDNVGFTDSLNEGLGLISTKWTARIDADDCWHPEKLEKQLAYLASNTKTKLIGCNYINVSDNFERQVNLPETDTQIRKYFVRDNPFGHSCVVFDTDLVRSIGGYNKEYYPSDDYELWFRLSENGSLYNLKETLCRRRLGDGISILSQNRQLNNCMRIQSKIIRSQKLPIYNYVYTVPTLLTLITPGWVRGLKRKFFN
jgi:glycosyltransferase involved in cell wall biosynthesis